MDIATNSRTAYTYVTTRLALQIIRLKYPNVTEYEDKKAFAIGLIREIEAEFREWERNFNERTVAD